MGRLLIPQLQIAAVQCADPLDLQGVFVANNLAQQLV